MLQSFMINNPLISIIIPTFNQDNLQIKAINSLLNQTYKNTELIVINDKSTDDTDKLIHQNYKNEISSRKIQYIVNQKNIGAAASRNKGAELAKGEILLFADSDEIFEQNHVEALFNFMQDSNADCVNEHTKIYIGENDEILDIRKYKYYGSDIFKLFHFGISGSDIMISKSLFFKLGGFTKGMKLGEDWEFLLRVHQAGYSLRYVDSGTTRHREHARSITDRTNWYQVRMETITPLLKERLENGQIKNSEFSSYLFSKMIVEPIGSWWRLSKEILSYDSSFFIKNPATLSYIFRAIKKRILRKVAA